MEKKINLKMVYKNGNTITISGVYWYNIDLELGKITYCKQESVYVGSVICCHDIKNITRVIEEA